MNERESPARAIGGRPPAEHFSWVQSFANSELLNEPGFDCGFAFAGGVPCGDRSGVIPALAYLLPNIFHWSIGFSRHNPILGIESNSFPKVLI